MPITVVECLDPYRNTSFLYCFPRIYDKIYDYLNEEGKVTLHSIFQNHSKSLATHSVNLLVRFGLARLDW